VNLNAQARAFDSPQELGDEVNVLDPPFIAGIKPECPIALNTLMTKDFIDLEQRLLENSGFV
jgi:hypothetical protein